MNQKLDRFKQLLIELTNLGRANALVGWDQQVYMPRGGTEDRGYVLATLAGLVHEKFTSAEMGNCWKNSSPRLNRWIPIRMMPASSYAPPRFREADQSSTEKWPSSPRSRHR